MKIWIRDGFILNSGLEIGLEPDREVKKRRSLAQEKRGFALGGVGRALSFLFSATYRLVFLFTGLD